MSIDIRYLVKQVTSLVRSGHLTPLPLWEGQGEGLLLVAFSGGGDSTALLRLLLSLGYKVEAAHCNFHLRGEESDRDETFCRDLCQQLGVKLHVAGFDTKAYAEEHKVSIEMAARTLRYDYFFRLVEECGYEGVCVAHHKDDSVETILLNMTRGTGLQGLRGILPQNGKILRPLLDVTHEEILDYLTSIGQDYIVDSSNLIADVQRNRIRLKVISELKKINPAAVDNIHKLSCRIQDLTAILDDAVKKAVYRVSHTNDKGETCVDIKHLLIEPGAETILWNILKDKGFSSSQVEQIFDNLRIEKKSGREWTSESHSLIIDRSEIIIAPKSDEPSKVMKIPETGTYIYTEEKKFRFSLVPVDADFQISKTADKVCLDADKIRFPLTVRVIRQGDWFIPFGMKGRKLLSDFLTDKKLSLLDKRKQLVITDSQGDIIWVVGLRPDNRYRLTPETKTSLVIEQTNK